MSDLIVEQWRPVFQQVIIRAICDALGYTNIPPAKAAHADAVKEAQAWFMEPDEYFDVACTVSGVDPARIRKAAIVLIQARWSGDYSRVPPHWKEVFSGNRMPNLTNIERALDQLNTPS